MTETRDNHYVPQWHQKGFFADGRNQLRYLSLEPNRYPLPGGETKDAPRSSIDYRRQRAKRVDPERERLKDLARDIHTASREAAGSRSISGRLKQQGEVVGRFKVRD